MLRFVPRKKRMYKAPQVDYVRLQITSMTKMNEILIEVARARNQRFLNMFRLFSNRVAALNNCHRKAFS